MVSDFLKTIIIVLLLLNIEICRADDEAVKAPGAPPPAEAAGDSSPSDAPADVKPDANDRDRKPKLYVKVYVAGGNSIQSSDFSSQGATGLITFDTNSTVGLSGEFFRAPRMSWGFDAGVEVDAPRQITSMTQTLNGVTTKTYFSPDPTIAVGDAYGNAVWRWNNLYLPVGVNVSYINAKNPAGSKFSGAFGGQLGLGWMSNRWAVEVVDRALDFKGSNPSIGDFGLLELNSINVNFKYGWNL